MRVEQRIGIFIDISFEEYIAIDAVNNSSLSDLERSPAHYFERHLNPDREPRNTTPSMALGTAIHTSVLEPERFSKTYCAKPTIDNYPNALDGLDSYKERAEQLGLKKSGTKAELKERILTADPAVVFFDDLEEQIYKKYNVIPPEHMEIACAISKRINKSAAASTILCGGNSEVTLLWIDPETGLYCKARIDYLSLGDTSFAVDLKSTQDAREYEFARSIVKYSYHRQVAHYLNGLAVLGHPAALFVFAAYETEAPYAASFFYADQEMIDFGRAEVSRLMHTLKECRETNSWPAYDDTLKPISLPKWKTKTAIPAELDVF